MSFREKLIMINVVAFEEQKGYRYTALVSAPFIILLGAVLNRIAAVGIDPIFLGGAVGILCFVLTHFALKQAAIRGKKKYGSQITEHYENLRKQEIYLLVGLLGCSLFLLGLMSLCC